MRSVTTEENKYRMCLHVGTDEPICRAEIEMHVWRTDLWAQQVEEGQRIDSSIAIYTLLCVKQIAGGKLLFSTGAQL